MDCRIRAATASDAATIVELVNKAFAVERFFKNADRTDLEEIQGLMNDGQFFSLMEHSRAIGCVFARIRDKRGYIGLLSVDPDRQGAGLGSMLMQHAEDYCRESGCQFADLRIVDLRTELLAFYGKRGYTPQGTAPADIVKFVTRPIQFVLMSKPLAGGSNGEK